MMGRWHGITVATKDQVTRSGSIPKNGRAFSRNEFFIIISSLIGRPIRSTGRWMPADKGKLRCWGHEGMWITIVERRRRLKVCSEVGWRGLQWQARVDLYVFLFSLKDTTVIPIRVVPSTENHPEVIQPPVNIKSLFIWLWAQCMTEPDIVMAFFVGVGGECN